MSVKALRIDSADDSAFSSPCEFHANRSHIFVATLASFLQPKSTNPFAALDDSDDEAPTSKPAPAPKKNKIVAPSSKPDPKSKPKNNDRNTKHGRGGRPPVRDGKRAYDRRSGTGRGKEIKKGGGGARNWGSDKNEAKKMEGRINENEELAMAVDGNDAEAPTEEVEPPKEDNTMTYAEYMASKGKKEETSLRETKNEFEGINAAAKEEEESFISMGRGKKKKDKKKKEVEKKTVDVGFRVVSYFGRTLFHAQYC